MTVQISAPLNKEGYIVDLQDPNLPKVIAELFCSMDSDQQAKFFHEIDVIDSVEWGHKAVFQWRWMEKSLSERARKVITDIYEHTTK